MQGMMLIHANKDNLCLYVILGPIGSAHRFPISIGVWKGFVYHWWWPRGMEMIFAMSHPVHCKYCKFTLLLFHLITLQYVCFSSWSKWLSCALKSVTFTCMLVTYLHTYTYLNVKQDVLLLSCRISSIKLQKITYTLIWVY